MAERLIDRNKSVTVAADVSSSLLVPLVKATHGVEGISAYKIG